MWQARTNKGKVVHRSHRSLRDRARHNFYITDVARIGREVFSRVDPTLVLSDERSLRAWLEIEYDTMAIQLAVANEIAQIADQDLKKAVLTTIELIRTAIQEARANASSQE